MRVVGIEDCLDVAIGAQGEQRLERVGGAQDVSFDVDRNVVAADVVADEHMGYQANALNEFSFLPSLTPRVCGSMVRAPT